MSLLDTPFTRQVRIEVPVVCGAMYPCSNPELVAAASAAGGVGVIQPISMIYAHKHDLREGIRLIRRLTDKPVGFNALVEKSSRVYEERMKKWVDVALEEGVRLFVTALGNPRWVVDRVHAVGGVVYHDVTERKWADLALGHGVDGLIAVNRRAGGHAGTRDPRALFAELADLGVPVIGAGGAGGARGFVELLEMGYAAVQMGTRFIATDGCNAHPDYKAAICRAEARDIVLTEKISGIPVAVIETEYIKQVGTKAGPIARRMLRHPRTKHWMRMFYQLRGVFQLKRASLEGTGYKDYFQAGKSVDEIERVEPVAEIVARLRAAAEAAPGAAKHA